MKKLISTIATMFFIWNCAAPISDSRVKIAHGTVIEESEFPAVVELTITNGAGTPVAGCTGTFVGANTILTAAHCLSGPILYKQNRPEHQISNRDWSSTRGYEHDLAVLIFENDIAPAIMPISTREPKLDEKLAMVGFGYGRLQGYDREGRPIGGTGSGIKRKAETIGRQLVSVGEAILLAGDLATSNRPGEARPTSLSGDSGGPLILNNRVVGTVSGGQPQRHQGEVQDVSGYPNLNATSSQRFLKAILDDANLGAKIEFASPDAPAGFPRLETMNLALIATGGNQALLQMSAQTSKGVGKIIFCFQEASACARDFFSTDKKLFYSELTKTGVKSSFDIFSSPAMNLTQAAYTITSIAVDVSGKVINSRSFLLSR